MKVLKIILVSLLIFLIAFGIPYIIHNNIYKEKYYTKANGATIAGPMGYCSLITEDKNATSNIKQNALELMNEGYNVLNGQRESFILLLLVTGIILSITILFIGILLKKLTNCQIPYISFIISGTLTAIAYLALYYIDVIIL